MARAGDHRDQREDASPERNPPDPVDNARTTTPRSTIAALPIATPLGPHRAHGAVGHSYSKIAAKASDYRPPGTPSIAINRTEGVHNSRTWVHEVAPLRLPRRLRKERQIIFLHGFLPLSGFASPQFPTRKDAHDPASPPAIVHARTPHVPSRLQLHFAQPLHGPGRPSLYPCP